MDERVWDATVFTNNRDRLLKHQVAKAVVAQVWQQVEQAKLISDELHVDGTLLKAHHSGEFSEEGGGQARRWRTTQAIRGVYEMLFSA